MSRWMVWLRFYVTTHFMQTVSRNGATRVVRFADTLKRPNMSWIICAANVVLTRFDIIDKYIASMDRNWVWMIILRTFGYVWFAVMWVADDMFAATLTITFSSRSTRIRCKWAIIVFGTMRPIITYIGSFRIRLTANWCN